MTPDNKSLNAKNNFSYLIKKRKHCCAGRSHFDIEQNEKTVTLILKNTLHCTHVLYMYKTQVSPNHMQRNRRKKHRVQYGSTLSSWPEW